jgi:transcriptional regulator with XRE-family HTH domain
MIVLEDERRSRGWTRTELARRSRMHPSDVGKVERQMLRPYPRQLLRLARALSWPKDRAEALLEQTRAETPPRIGDEHAH